MSTLRASGMGFIQRQALQMRGHHILGESRCPFAWLPWQRVLAIGNPNAKQLIGQDLRTFKDPTGKEFGKEQYAAAQKPEGQITEVTYLFPKPGTDPKPVPKVAFVTRAGDLGCGVGYYK